MKNTRRKVLLLELNEINWRVIDKIVADHGADYLPNFAKLKREGAWGTQSAVERAQLLDPWVTWVTLHTGVSPAVHGAAVLEQEHDTITAKRTWHYATEAGRSVGVFGSVSAFPPSPVQGFMVPGPFAPSDDTFPEALQPIQAINRRYTQLHNKTGAAPSAMENLRTGARLIRLGLKASTCLRVAAQLANERLRPHSRWQRVSLQPRLNFDFFSKLYRSERPDYATWHSNHAAHYMHHYWRAWDDSQFPVKSSAAEREHYGQAVPYGYRLCDDLIGRAMDLLDEDTVLVVASSMGQQPYVNEKYEEGKIVVRIKDIDRLLAVIGADGIEEAIPTMVPQWNVAIPNAARRAQVKAQFEAVRRGNGLGQEPGFAVSETGKHLTVTPLGLAKLRPGIRYTFPRPDGTVGDSHAMEDLFATDTPTVKQGMHHIDGLIALYGAGIPAGKALPGCTNLDVAPTLLSLMGIAVPSVMEGRVIEEAMA